MASTTSRRARRVGGPGADPAPGPHAARPRRRRSIRVLAARGRGDVGRHDDPDRRCRSLQGDAQLLRRRPARPTTCSATKWTPLLARRPAVVRRLAAASPARFYITGIAMIVAIPLGSAVGDLPRRVRHAARPQGRQAGARGPRRRADDRLRLLRPHVLHARRSSRPLLRRRGHRSPTSSPPACIVGLLVLPTIASVAEDAMTAVPGSLREGAFGLGAKPHAVVAARGLPGRAVGRHRGDRARRLARDRRDRRHPACRRLRPAAAADAVGSADRAVGLDGRVHRLAPRPATSPTGSIAYKTIFAVGFTLFVICLVLNLVSIRLVNKYRQVYE